MFDPVDQYDIGVDVDVAQGGHLFDGGTELSQCAPATWRATERPTCTTCTPPSHCIVASRFILLRPLIGRSRSCEPNSRLYRYLCGTTLVAVAICAFGLPNSRSMHGTGAPGIQLIVFAYEITNTYGRGVTGDALGSARPDPGRPAFTTIEG